MPDDRVHEAKGRVKDAADQIPENDSHDNQARTTVKDERDNLLDTLPGRGSE